MSYINNYDIILLTETWTSNLSNIHINGYESFNCPRLKCNKKAKRDSGGIAIYYKQYLSNHIELMKCNQVGIVWLKLSKQFLCVDNDAYFCVCYIPPEGSAVYRNRKSSLYEVDFFELLNADYMFYNNLGDVYVTGDLNSRVGENLDYIENIDLDRFVNIPIDDTPSCFCINRKSMDKQINIFGNKFLSLCKENNIKIANGRLEEGQLTYHCVNRNRGCGSVVDYIITKAENFKYISSMKILDLSEYSDHCPIHFTMNYVKINSQNIENEYIDKIVWDSTRSKELNSLLLNKVNFFETITNQIIQNEITIDDGVVMFSNAIYESSFQLFGKTFNKNKKSKSKNKSKVDWFDETCKQAKATFLNSKRNLKQNTTEENKIIFLQNRAVFINIKRRAKIKYLSNEKKKLSELSKKAPRKFWKIINKYKKKKIR